MKVKRKTTLGQALDEVVATASQIREKGALPDGRMLRLEREVTLEIEFEREKDERELEFEIKWRRRPRPFWRRLWRRLLG